MINPKIFKAYDIRGLYPEEINEEAVYQIGRAYAELLFKESGTLRQAQGDRRLRVVVGQDMRVSSPSLTESLIKGLTEAGADVVDVGLVSSPTFYFAVAYYGYDGGVQVSASHNPKEYNGLKLVRAGARPFGEQMGMEELKGKVWAGGFAPASRGQVTKREGVVIEEVNCALNKADVSKIKPFKIVADPANAMGILYLEELFKHLPCDLIKMNFELDGSFPSHPPDPFKPENNADLCRRVVEEGADLGIATDGDGDRLFFVSNKGEIVDPAIVRGWLSQIFLRESPGAIICYDIRPGQITLDMILAAGGKPVVTRVGHSLIKQKMLEVGALFGGESSGHFFFSAPWGTFEMPSLMILKILTDLSEKNVSVDEFIRPYKKYFASGEVSFKLPPNRDKKEILEKLEEHYRDGEINKLDGLSVRFKDWWFNMRPSNTEPLMRLNVESMSKELTQSKVKEILALCQS